MRGPSLSFDSHAATVGIGGTIRAKGTACTVRIVDGVWRKRRPEPTVGVAGRIRIAGVGAQLAEVFGCDRHREGTECDGGKDGLLQATLSIAIQAAVSSDPPYAASPLKPS